jgi:hypothetical protein
MHSQHHAAETNWWSEDYRGRQIAILNHYGRLHVYLDHVLQHNVVFDSGEAALAWLRQRIDQGPSQLNLLGRTRVRNVSSLSCEEAS